MDASDIWGKNKRWQAFSTAEMRVIEDRGDYVVIQEVMLPDDHGPILMLVDDDNPAEWICRRFNGPKLLTGP